MKSCKQIPVLGKIKCQQLVFKLLVFAIRLQCTMGLDTFHLLDEGDDYDVISTFNGLSAIQCSLQCATSAEKCDAIASEAEGGKIGSCKLLKFANATVTSLAPPNRLDKGKTKPNIMVLKQKRAPNPVDGAWGEWSTGSYCHAPCSHMMRGRARACDSPAPLHSGTYCDGDNSDSVPCGTLDCVNGDEAQPYCESKSMSLATVPDTDAAKQALADALPFPNVFYWFKIANVNPSYGSTYIIKSRPGYTFSIYARVNRERLPAACETWGSTHAVDDCTGKDIMQQPRYQKT